MVELLRDADPACGCLILRPNDSAGWRHNIRIFAVLAIIGSAVALYWATQGVYLVLAFAGLELLALYLGLPYVCRHCIRQEVLHLTRETVRLECGIDHPHQTYEFERYFTRVEVARRPVVGGQRAVICLRCKSHSVPIGRFLNDEDIGILQAHLRSMISAYQTAMPVESS